MIKGKRLTKIIDTSLTLIAFFLQVEAKRKEEKGAEEAARLGVEQTTTTLMDKAQVNKPTLERDFTKHELISNSTPKNNLELNLCFFSCQTSYNPYVEY